MTTKPKILFILKLRQQYGVERTPLKSSGLLNSATFVSDMLMNNGYETKLVQVIDNNSIDREVHLFKPDIVIIEALWVVPEKFEVLQQLHPHVKWIIRLHSEIPFLAGEGIALEWINRYLSYNNVYVSFNSLETHDDFIRYLSNQIVNSHFLKRVVFLPNYYPIDRFTPQQRPSYQDRGVIEVGCFGAIRPLKNQLIQAFAAVEFARRYNLNLRFHINAGRTDNDSGRTVLKNIRQFFAKLPPDQFQLIEHAWLDRNDFLEVISYMDIGLQVSLTETFNIVTADFVACGVPVVVSPEIDWLSNIFYADPTHVNDIVSTMERSLLYTKWFWWVGLPQKSLIKYANKAERTWLANLRQL